MQASDDPIEAVSQRLASFVTDQSATWASEGAEAAGFVRAGADDSPAVPGDDFLTAWPAGSGRNDGGSRR